MPYYVFRMGMFKVLEKQAEWATFKEAKAHTNELRKTLDPKTGDKYKMIFAENEIRRAGNPDRPRANSRKPVSGDDW